MTNQLNGGDQKIVVVEALSSHSIDVVVQPKYSRNLGGYYKLDTSPLPESAVETNELLGERWDTESKWQLREAKQRLEIYCKSFGTAPMSRKLKHYY